MIRNLKMLGAAVLAVLALGGMGAAGAHASTFESEAESTTIISTPDGTAKTSHFVLDIAGASVTCNYLSSSTTVIGKIVDRYRMIGLSWLGCNFVGQVATVNANECSLEFTAGGAFSILCPAGNEITVSVPNPICDVVLPAQLNKGSVTYHNITTGTSKEITMTPNVSNIKHTATGPGCPETGTFENGTLTTNNTIWTGQDHSKNTVNIQWKF